MKATFASSLGFLQFIFLLGKGALYVCGVDVGWGLTLIPLWILLFIAVIFWGILGAIAHKVS